jgi:CRP/FNR family transcriptional regulator, anaerobic regulatory protein
MPRVAERRFPGETFRPRALPASHPCHACEVRLLSVCGVLSCDELARLRSLGGMTRLAAGRPLIHEGDRAASVFNVVKGALKLYKLLPDGRRQVTGFLFPGDFLGITLEDEYAFTAEALGPSELCRFPRQPFLSFADAHPHLERRLYRLAAHELAAAQDQMLLLGRKTAPERVASFLLLLARRAAERGESPDLVYLPMSRTDIADYLGLTKETVSRTVTAFKTGGLIRLRENGYIAITDRPGLEDIAEAQDGG